MVTLDQAGWRRAALVIQAPPQDLAGVVEFFWTDARSSAGPPLPRWRIVPDDAPHLIYARFTDGTGRVDRHRLHVVGARRRYADIDCSRRVLTLGVRLHPGALPVLFGLPARELTDRSVAAELLARDQARRALGGLEDASVARATDHIGSFLRSLIDRRRVLDERARWLASTARGGPCTIRDVASRLGIGERALHAWAMSHLGLGLKRFLTVRRLHAALAARLADGASTWSRVAAVTGYADQSHLVRDCRALLGESPNEFLSRAR